MGLWKIKAALQRSLLNVDLSQEYKYILSEDNTLNHLNKQQSLLDEIPVKIKSRKLFKQDTMDDFSNITLLKMAIKEEIDSQIDDTEANETSETLEVKSEKETTQELEETENVFDNVQIEVKQEDRDLKIEINEEEKTLTNQVTNSTNFNDNVAVDVKQEAIEESHEYQGFDSVSINSVNSNEARSIDSYEAAALGNVETCLQEEINIKLESYMSYDDSEKNFTPSAVKIESDLSIPQTSNGLPPIQNEGMPKDAVVKLPLQSEEKILPCDDVDNTFQLNSITGDLPSFDEGDSESFQLNSITGNILSLEQEAYGLLKAKRKKIVPKSKSYICSECPKSYNTKGGWKAHFEVHRSIERRTLGFQKGIQTKLDKKNKELNKHIKEEPFLNGDERPKREGYECTCGKTFRRRSRMETCLRSHDMSDEMLNYVSCVTCKRSFKSKEELVSHRQRSHRKRFPCKFCPTDYNTRKELCKHLKLHQKVQLMEYKVISEVMKGKQKLKCFMCAKTFTALTELKIHVMHDHKEPYVCQHCKKAFNKIIDIVNHTKTYHPEVEGQSVLDVLEAFSKLIQAWKCNECGLQLLEADKLALHQIEQHNPELKAEQQFQCTDCRRVFISQKGLTSHRRVHHSIEPPEESKEVEQGIMCLECRKICKDMQALTSHMRLHSPDRKYPCKFCDFRFATPEKRKAHAEIHTGDMKYVCFICEYQCSSENRLKQHKLSLKHANMREYLLTGKPLIVEPTPSSEKSKKKESKKRKIDDVTETVSSSSDITCDICGEQFNSESEMLEHKQTHPFIEFPNEDTPTRIFFK